MEMRIFITENVNINENLDIKIELVYIGEVHLFFFPLLHGLKLHDAYAVYAL